MSDTIQSEIQVTTSNGDTVSMSPGDFQDYLAKASKISTVTTSIKVSRSIPRDKFEKNEYFFSTTTVVEGAYEAVESSQGDETMIRNALGASILQRVQKGFDLGRIALIQQQKSDMLSVVNLANQTTV